MDAGANAIKELQDFINGFINKYAPKKRRKSHSKKCKIQREKEEETTLSCSFSDKENFIEIENPVVYSKRGAPKKKRFKGSHELVSKKKSSAKEHSNAQKTRKQTQCQQYQNTGHNKA
ncbi:28143_t:CDS:2, partial [Gigaspora margarita]